jgi:transglutaminase-like putative cysteine protease
MRFRSFHALGQENLKRKAILACALLSLVAAPAFADQPAATSSLPALYREALRLEEARELTRAEAAYRELVGRCDEKQWRMRRDAQQGLRRVEDLRAEFALTEAQLHERLAKTYRDYQPQELGDWEKRGWILSREVEGKKQYSSLNPTNIGFFDTQLMARNEPAAKNYREFARLFLEESAKLDSLRAESAVRQSHVAPVRYVYSCKAVVCQTNLPPGRLVRAWFPCPLLTPAAQNIRIVSVQPPGALKHGPDVESDLGIVYLEAPRPEKDDLVIGLEVAFDTHDTDCQIHPDAIPPYDTGSAFYRRFTRSEQQMALTTPLRELARSVVGGETNPYRRARKLYDWVCDHLTYNFVWRWRDATFTHGCASEEVRQRRIGDCVIQSVFYAALCRSVGVPARVHNGPIFPPGMKNDHVWAEVYFPNHGWFPVDVTYSEVAHMAPGLEDAQRRRIRDFFFGRLDRWRFITQRNDLAQELVPTKRSPRRRVTMFVRPELECGGQDVERAALTWECRPEAVAAPDGR